MNKTWFILFMILIFYRNGFSQSEKTVKAGIKVSGVIRDASTLVTLPNSQIRINRFFSSVSDKDGTFTIIVSKGDTVEFSLLGYKSEDYVVSDTLSGREFISGIYLSSDTLSIGEVIILPRIAYLKSDLLKSPVTITPEMENAKYNMAISAYQGRISMSKLGDPASNYSLLRQRQSIDAYEKGGIPSDRIVGFSPFLLFPAAFLLINGLPEKPLPMKPDLTRQELDQIHKKYLEQIQKTKQ